MNLQQVTRLSFVDFAEQILTTEPQKSVTHYALSSFTELMRSEFVMDAPDAAFIRLWIASEVTGGKKVGTCRRYFGKLHSLYSEWAGSEAHDPFTELTPLFDTLQDADTKEVEQNLRLVKRLLGKNEKSADWQLVRIFFYLLYNPAATLADVASLTFDNAPRFCPQLNDLVSATPATHGRKYVFDLKQGKARPAEIERKLLRELSELLTATGMRFGSGFARGSITALWVAAARSLDISLADIRACIAEVPRELSALAIVEPSDIIPEAREHYICRVADSINDYTSRWFVMKLRPGVTVDELKDAINTALPGRLASMTLFYPTRTEVQKKDHRRVSREVPYLPNIVFFRTQANRVKSLFASIGDLAWCFRTSNSPESDYAVVSNSQMAIFQQCIGRFTDDIQVNLVDASTALRPGRRVKVVGGIMAGYEGEILDVTDEPGRRIFFLSIGGTHLASWTAHVDDIYLQPAE